MNKISVITINYNNKKGLEKTILSVISQNYDNLEYIIIDGGSTDGSVDIIKKYSDRITYWISEPDKGIYNAMNKGINKITGDYCNFMNSGDVFYDNQVLSDIFSTHQNSDIITGTTILDSKPVKYWYPQQEITFYQMFKGTISHQASFIKSSLFYNDNYDETIKIVADWAFFLKKLILDNCSYKAINRVICVYDMTGVSTLTSFEEERLSVLNKMISKRILDDYFTNDYGFKLAQRYNKCSKLGKKIFTFASILLTKFFPR